MKGQRTGDEIMSIGWYKFWANVYGLFKYPKRLGYEDACEQIRTAFQMLTFQEKWCRYHPNEPRQHECLSPEEVYENINDEGFIYDDCDGYAAMAIDPLQKHGVVCDILCMFTRKSGHATLLIHEKNDKFRTLGNWGYWNHGECDVLDVCEDFYPSERIECFYITDRNWDIKAYGEVMPYGEFLIAVL